MVSHPFHDEAVKWMGHRAVRNLRSKPCQVPHRRPSGNYTVSRTKTMKIQNRLIGSLLAATLPLSCVADVCVYKTPSVRHVAGIVVDSTGQPILDVKIAIIRRGEPVATATTDDSGRFRFDSLKQGTYELAVTAVGFQSAHYTILLNHPSLHWHRSLQIELAVGLPHCGGDIKVVKMK
jgi:5-hydroxyisourate hydrolase-like protein (transthyretin family)